MYSSVIHGIAEARIWSGSWWSNRESTLKHWIYPGYGHSFEVSTIWAPVWRSALPQLLLDVLRDTPEILHQPRRCCMAFCCWRQWTSFEVCSLSADWNCPWVCLDGRKSRKNFFGCHASYGNVTEQAIESTDGQVVRVLLIRCYQLQMVIYPKCNHLYVGSGLTRIDLGPWECLVALRKSPS